MTNLAETHPNLVEEWDYNKNQPLLPEHVSAGSGRKIWWKCELGHEWEAKVSNRAANRNCPVCANRIVLPGFNDLATTHPELAEEWGSANEKNPTEVLAGSRMQAHWVCANDPTHQWSSTIVNRKKGTGCPQCYKISRPPQKPTTPKPLKPLPEKLKNQWHPTKNGNLDPAQFTTGSGKKIWWLCEKGHEWKIGINNRSNGTSCPVCSNFIALPGYNDLTILNPELANQWHKTKNLPLTPNKVTVNSGRKVWWECDLGHEYEAVVDKRTHGQGCPYCVNRKILVGFNDLTTTHPHLLNQYHPKNLTPFHSLISGSDKKVWWVCAEGHEWETQTRSRAINKTGCPTCTSSSQEQELTDFFETIPVTLIKHSRKIIAPYELDFYFPEQNLAVEFNGIYWHSEKNGKKKWYHHTKHQMCKDKGIQLIQVWEDDWKCNPELIKQMIIHKLGINTQPKIYARNTKIVEVPKETAKLFLQQNHIQGNVEGSIRLGLTENTIDDIKALIIAKTEPGTSGQTLNLLRFATSQPVPGGFTKLLKHIETHYTPEKIITFSDNSVSDGGLYEKTGFIEGKKIPPDYMYLVKNERKHKFGYRLKRFREDPELIYEEGLTERQLAEINKLHRIWDAGKIRWEKDF